MKTATITLHASNNNGSFFQAYALQKVLVLYFGIDNQIIDYQSQKNIHLYSVFRPIHSVRDMAKNLISLLHCNAIKKRNQRFSDMRARYFHVTERCSTIDDAVRIADQFELVIAGSDQIWNTGAPDFSEAYLLPRCSSRKIAYGVSFGSFLADSRISEYKEVIQAFDVVSAREESARKYLESMISREVDRVIDPTLLLKPKDYEGMIQNTPLVSGDYIFFYSISCPSEVLQVAKKMADQMGIKIITVFASFHSVICRKYGIEIRFDAGPSEFLNLIRNAKLVLTNSFHGTAFSIIYRRPFFHICKTIDGELQRDERINDIIDALELQECNIGINSIPKSLPDIDWEKVAQKKEEMKRHAFEYLNRALRRPKEKKVSR